MSDYFRNLQNIATEQDRAKLAAVVAEYRSTLQQLPKLQQEMDSLLVPGQSLDYIDLTKNVRPKLEQAARFLFDLDQLPAELRNAREVTEFVQSTKANMTLQTIAPLIAKLSYVCSSARQHIDSEKTKAQAEIERRAEEERRTRQIAKDAEIKRKAEEERRTKEIAENKELLTYLVLMFIGVVFGGWVGWFHPDSDSTVDKFIAVVIGGLMGGIFAPLILAIFFLRRDISANARGLIISTEALGSVDSKQTIY